MKRGFSPWRDLPATVWLAAVPIVAFAHPWIPEPRWLLLHLLLLGAVTHSIVVWSQHFADALLHVPSTPHPRLLALLNVGALAVMVGTQTARWPVTLVGAAAVAGAVLWHAVRLTGQLRRALPARFSGVVRYYVTAAALLPVGATLGVLLARGLPDPWHDRVMLAHVAVNMLGWVGLTVAGTVVTLWPTMLRTRLGAGSDLALRRALPILLTGVLVTAGGCLLGLWLLAAAGLVAYVGGVVLLGIPLVEAARRKPPTGHPTWSLAAGLLWLLGCLVAWAAILATSGDAHQVHHRFDSLVPFLAVGFAAQVLLGAMGYLIPTALGGGGTAVRAAGEVLDRAGAFRVAAVNLGLVVCLLPAPSAVTVGCSLVVLLALAAELPLLMLAIRASRQRRPTPARTRRALGSAVAGASVVLLTVAAGVAVDPAALDTGHVVSAAAGVTPTGHTTTVRVEAGDMRFVPSEIDVPAGDRLVIDVVNTDNQMHDLVLETGADSGRLSPGDETRVDVGVVGRGLDGWCSLVGHRQMGMTLTVNVTEPGHHHVTAAAPSDHQPRDAVLPPLTGTGPQTHHLTLDVTEVEQEVAPGVTQRLWTYGGSAPGPVLHGRVGDRFVVTLVNDGTIGHSIDFHAGALAPDRPMRTIEPGQTLTYRFTARRAGVWMYHCSTMPMSVHIANGMFGAVVIEPRDLAPVDRSFLVVQSEQYRGAKTVDPDQVLSEQPDAVVFNGYPNQYDDHPLQVDAGDRVRIWVLDAGPNRATSFHVVGGQFTTTYAEGSYLLRGGDGGAQSLALMPAQGGFVELELDQPGHYPFVSHVMVDAERGAHGLLEVR